LLEKKGPDIAARAVVEYVLLPCFRSNLLVATTFQDYLEEINASLARR
jgi:hypothetical protein